ncbi:MFS transporter [Pararhizobium sp. A13]|uniref:MFS transporter n=1 Tax=Pararhizobium sp. A13 TaxID=3133975 RepID=UPI00311AC0F2
MSSSAGSGSFKPIYFLALGTFAIGTEGFMIVPLLPKMSADLSVPIAAVGSLVTIFTLTLAISSPILTTLTGSLNRRKLLIWSMLAFAAANLVAWASRDYWGIMVARILLALAAGLYTPNANALAGAIVSPEKRGRALSIVNGGITLAIALGLPLGSLIGDAFGWRMTFLGVGLLSLIAVAGLVFGLHKGVGDHMKVASFGERVAVAGNPQILVALLVTFIWAAGAYTAWTYIAPYLTSTIGASSNGISAIVSVWGLSAAAGVFGGGALNDRVGANAVMAPALTLLAMAFLTLSASAYFLTPGEAIAPVVVAVIVWGLTAWGFFPSQISRLIGIGGHQLAPIVLSLNASFMYAGFAAGAALGSVVISNGSVVNLGWVAAAVEVVALGLLVATTREASRAQSVQP